jgi:hypothetical protein
MLEPNERRLLMDSLRPPEGYELSAGIGTTYSLDLEALLFAPLAFTMFDRAEADSDRDREPLALIESLRRYASRLTVFCQAGEMTLPRRNQKLLSALEDSVVQVFAPMHRNGALFHPKVWVLRYVPRGPEIAGVRYRLLVMSRNLTLSKSWDVMVALDGQLKDRRKAYASNHPLGDFIEALPAMAHDVIPDRIERDVTLVQDEIRRVEFEFPIGVDNLGFWPLGLSGKRSNPFQDLADRTLIVSPFVGEDWLISRIGSTTGSILVSREEELVKLSESLLSKLECFYVGVPDPLADSDDEQAEEIPGDRPELSGLHAKVFVMDDGWDAHAFLGSANATSGAFQLNVEFMVELIGKRSALGIKNFFDPNNGKGGLYPLLLRYQTAPDQGRPDPLDEIRRVSEAVKIQIADTGLSGHIASSLNGEDSYTLAIESASRSRPFPENVDVFIWPVTLGEGRSVQVTNGAEGVHIEFHDLTLLQLSAFFAVKAVLKDWPDAKAVQFAIRIPVEGFPTSRPEALLRSMLSDPSAVARYLAMLLAPNDELRLGALFDLNQPGSATDSPWRAHDGGLFEAVLTALHSDPQQLQYIDKFVRDFRVDPKNGQDFLPKRFLELWAAVSEAALEMAK